MTGIIKTERLGFVQGFFYIVLILILSTMPLFGFSFKFLAIMCIALVQLIHHSHICDLQDKILELEDRGKHDK